MVPHPPPSLSKRFLTLRHDASQYVWEILIGCLARKTRDGSSFVSATNRRGNMQRSEVRAPTTYRTPNEEERVPLGRFDPHLPTSAGCELSASTPPRTKSQRAAVVPQQSCPETAGVVLQSSGRPLDRLACPTGDGPTSTLTSPREK